MIYKVAAQNGVRIVADLDIENYEQDSDYSACVQKYGEAFANDVWTGLTYKLLSDGTIS